MDDYISRQAAKNALTVGFSFHDYAGGTACAIIDDIPSADVRPVRRGKWEYHPELGWGETWICSQCGEKTTSTVFGYPRYEYCPMCGAYMGEKQNGN